ncbi:MAG: S28 family serine protease [Ignavibacteria bacterium]|jgi:hypothetical protein
MKNKSFLFPALIVIFSFTLFANPDEQTELYNWLNSVDGVEVYKVEYDSTMFTEGYKVYIQQPVDHKNPDGPKFKQRIYISHMDKDKPVVVYLSGYSITNVTTELTKVIDANQVSIEHRYFGESVPEPFDWQYLTVWQSATDHHKIIELLKEYYKGKWVSTGISKGGQATIFHRRYYEDDVDASVSYDAPLNLEEEERRIYTHLETVGTKECRDKILAYQRMLLKNKDEIMPLMKEYAKEKNMSFDHLGYEKAFEYAVLEYSFSFWQLFGPSCEDIPGENTTVREMFDYLKKQELLEYVEDKNFARLDAFFYQAFTEIGYYAYDTTPFEGLLDYAQEGTNHIFDPPGVEMTFNSDVMLDIRNWLRLNGNNMLYIYGEYDPCSASAVALTGRTNSIVMFRPKGNHMTKIKYFSKEDRQFILSKLEEWLDIEINYEFE